VPVAAPVEPQAIEMRCIFGCPQPIQNASKSGVGESRWKARAALAGGRGSRIAAGKSVGDYPESYGASADTRE